MDTLIGQNTPKDKNKFPLAINNGSVLHTWPTEWKLVVHTHLFQERCKGWFVNVAHDWNLATRNSDKILRFRNNPTKKIRVTISSALVSGVRMWYSHTPTMHHAVIHSHYQTHTHGISEPILRNIYVVRTWRHDWNMKISRWGDFWKVQIASWETRSLCVSFENHVTQILLTGLVLNTMLEYLIPENRHWMYSDGIWT